MRFREEARHKSKCLAITCSILVLTLFHKDQTMSDKKKESDNIQFHHPSMADSPNIWHLVQEVGTLDSNSSYAYVLMCRHFAHTCVIATLDDDIVGFITGYRPPEDNDVLFVWQVGVAPKARGKGVAGRMLDWLVHCDGCQGIQFLETTVSPTNDASRAMFAGLARRLNTELEPKGVFPSGLFPEPGHEPEPLLRIGPFSTKSNS